MKTPRFSTVIGSSYYYYRHYYYGVWQSLRVLPVGPESLFVVAVRHVQDAADAGRHVHDAADARHDVRPSADELSDVAYLVAFRQREDVLHPGRRRDLLVQPDQQSLERQKRLVAHRRLQAL